MQKQEIDMGNGEISKGDKIFFTILGAIMAIALIIMLYGKIRGMMQ